MSKFMCCVFVLVILCSTSCSTHFLIKENYLVGTWKVENKEQFEIWEKKGNTFEGYSYKVQDGEEKRMESLLIKKVKNDIIYVATVPNQNQGKGIPFTLNKKIKDFLSFENLEHDFPKKIQYHNVSDREVLVKVLGEDNKGFSYKMFKQ